MLLLLLACHPDDPAAPTSGSLAVLTYNIHGLPPSITGDDTAARAAAIAPLLEPFDVVGIQEDWLPETHDALDTVSHETRFRFDTPLEGRVYGAGLAFYARIPSTAYT